MLHDVDVVVEEGGSGFQPVAKRLDGDGNKHFFFFLDLCVFC
jgi:hypothetical protein